MRGGVEEPRNKRLRKKEQRKRQQPNSTLNPRHYPRYVDGLTLRPKITSKLARPQSQIRHTRHRPNRKLTKPENNHHSHQLIRTKTIPLPLRLASPRPLRQQPPDAHQPHLDKQLGHPLNRLHLRHVQEPIEKVRVDKRFENTGDGVPLWHDGGWNGEGD